MKIFPLLLAIFLILGCESKDPRAKIYNTSVTTIDNHVCVLIPEQGGEYLVSLEVVGSGESERLSKFFEGGVNVAADRCLPLYGYVFDLDEVYSVTAHIKSKKDFDYNQAGRLYTVSFSLNRDDKNKLQASVTR